MRNKCPNVHKLWKNTKTNFYCFYVLIWKQEQKDLGSSFTSAPLGNALNTKYIILSVPSVKYVYPYLQHENFQ